MLTESEFEKIWDALLSRNAQRIRATFTLLDEGSQAEVVRHLQLMVGDADWHPEQVKSARAALKALKGIS